MKDYVILEATSRKELSELVIKALKDGWVCQGGVSVIQDSSFFKYFQAMYNENNQ